MKRLHLNLISLVWLLTAASLARANDYYVATTGSDSNPGTSAVPFRTIAKAISMVTFANTIYLANGTYYEHDLGHNLSSYSLRSQSGDSAACIIDCQGLGAGLYLNGVQHAVSGVTIRNGVTSAGHTAGGLTILVGSFGSPQATVSNCLFSNCKSTAGDGSGADALYLYEPTSVTITGCVFSNNGGGTTAGALVGWTNAISIFDLTISGCTFTGNISGGADITRANTILTDCKFANNGKADYGAGFSMQVGSLIANRCVFTDNHLTATETYQGAALYCVGAKLILNSCLFSNNTCNDPIFPGSQIFLNGIPTKITNCTIVKTVATSKPHANIVLWAHPNEDGSESLTVVNSIARGSYLMDEIHTPPFAGDPNDHGHFKVTYSNMEHGNYPDVGNINSDPRFVNDAAGNYRLQSSSPCVNTATVSAPELPATDLDGGLRILGSAPDMGAYEFWSSGYGVWFVDKTLGNDTTGTGSPFAPFKTVNKAVTSASNGHKIYIKAANYGTDRPRITKNLKLFNWFNTGLARIGKP